MISASARQNHALESHFGPSSEPIDIPNFVENAATLPELEASTTEEDFGVDDILEPISEVWNKPELSAYLVKSHELVIDELHRRTKPGVKKKKPVASSATAEKSSAVKELEAHLSEIKISSYSYPMDAAGFTRAVKNSDLNALRIVKSSRSSEEVDDESPADAILTITVYGRGNSGLFRISQHAFLDSHTLGDVFEAIPCVLNDMPRKVTSLDEPPRYAFPHEPDPISGVAMLVENTVYGDGMHKEDYADRLCAFLEATERMPEEIEKSPTPIFEAKLRDLLLRLHEPYWVLHRGNCEHFLVVDQIRLKHASDPCSGYPLTLQLTPVQLDLCRICVRLPATVSIVGDERLGESPCPLCGPCASAMGPSTINAGVISVPLGRYRMDSNW